MGHSDLFQSYSGDPAWRRLIDSSRTSDAVRIPLITKIFSDSDETEAAKGLYGDDAQSFVDVVEEVLHFLSRTAGDLYLDFAIVPGRCWID